MKKILKIASLSVMIVLFSACSATSKFTWLNRDETILSAHRGAHTVAPENTVESIKKASEMGYKVVEIDPRVSSDGKIYLMHDNTVDRTTNGKGPLEEKTAQQINQLKINTVHYPKFSHKTVRVPTFEEAVKAVSENHLLLNVDGSKGNWLDKKFVNKIVGIVKSYGMFEKTFFVLSDKKEREFLNRLYPEACVSWLFDSNQTIDQEIKEAKSYQNALLSVSNKFATKEVIEKLNQSNVYYQIYSVNDKKRYEELKKWKAKMIETDTLVP